MKRTTLLWIIAFLITATTAIYQRMTGPTHPFSGSATIGGKKISYNLLRSHGGTTDAQIEIVTNDSTIDAYILWKRYRTDDPETKQYMIYDNGVRKANLPNQPPAGKLQYHIVLLKNDERIEIPGENPLIIRFKGDVPLWVLLPHILAMFCAMLFSTRAGLQFFDKGNPLNKKLIYWIIGFLFVGGFILGPLMQWYAFGAFWTGWPLGTDLTDNKTAIALLAWLIAAFLMRKSSHPSRWVLGAAIVTFIVFLIPHSVLGSELDYKALDAQKTHQQVQ